MIVRDWLGPGVTSRYEATGNRWLVRRGNVEVSIQAVDLPAEPEAAEHVALLRLREAELLSRDDTSHLAWI